MATRTAPLVLRIADREDIGRHELAPLGSAGALLQDAVRPARDLPARVWVSIFIASLRAAREAIEAHVRETERGELLAAAVRRQPGLAPAVERHVAEHGDLVERINDTIREARACVPDDSTATEPLRQSALIVASRLAAHENRTRTLVSGPS